LPFIVSLLEAGDGDPNAPSFGDDKSFTSKRDDARDNVGDNDDEADEEPLSKLSFVGDVANWLPRDAAITATPLYIPIRYVVIWMS
jgi:hypothetical protein